MGNKKQRAVIYTRVSDGKQVDGYSLSAQLDRCREVIDQRGYELVGDMTVDKETGLPSNNGGVLAYCDPGVTATDYKKKRDGLNKLLAYKKNHGFDKIVVWRVDRFARSNLVFHYFFRELGRNDDSFGYHSFVICDGVSSDKPHVIIPIILGLAEDEIISLKHRVYQGRTQKASLGQWPEASSTLPYGYDLADDKKAVVINEIQAEWVRRIFSWYCEGISTNKIADKLIALGVPTLKGGLWRHQTVIDMIDNRSYIGEAEVTINPVDPNDDPVTYQIDFPRIITRDQFNRAANIRQKHRDRHGGPSKRHYMLNRMVKCSECGGSFNPNWSKTHVYYQHRPGLGHCTSKAIKGEYLESYVWESIAPMLIDQTFLEYILEQYRLNAQKKHSETIAWRDTLENQLADLEKQIERTRNIYRIDESYTDEKFKADIAALNVKRANVQRELVTVEKELAGIFSKTLDRGSAARDRMVKIILSLTGYEHTLFVQRSEAWGIPPYERLNHYQSGGWDFLGELRTYLRERVEYRIDNEQRDDHMIDLRRKFLEFCEVEVVINPKNGEVESISGLWDVGIMAIRPSPNIIP